MVCEQKIYLHSRFHKGNVSPLVFGGFLEHLGRAVYGGVFDPTSKYAGKDGLRSDVLNALESLGMTIMRWPGGNFVSDYHWEDGVGPKEHRPTVRNLAWTSMESNQFGTDEFLKLCEQMNWAPMIACNLGTGSPEEARNWVEYCNFNGASRNAEMRRKNGRVDPYNVKYWCLGNEVDGIWQIGHTSAEQYSSLARQLAHMITGKFGSTRIEPIFVGSSSPNSPTYAEWDRKVLEEVGKLWKSFENHKKDNQPAHISLHHYAANDENNSQEYLATGVSIDRQIQTMDSVCNYVQARLRLKSRFYLCFDEWNVWYKNRQWNGKDQFSPHLLEEVYNLEDALVVAQFFNSFIRHADVVKIANIAQVVNVIAPILTRGDKLIKQSTFYVFQLFSEVKSGISLDLALEGPSYEIKKYGAVDCIDSSAILNKLDRQLTLFLVNRSTDYDIPISVYANSFHDLRLDGGIVLSHSDLKAANLFDSPCKVVPQPYDAVSIVGDEVSFNIPQASFMRIILKF